MPIFTSLLFFFIALALLPLALRNSSMRQERRRRKQNKERMNIGARICEAAARDAFGLELDHSPESIASLDSLITHGWGDGTVGTAGTNDLSAERDDPTFVLGAYVGNVFVRNGKAEWQFEDGKALLYFPKWKRKVSLFDLIQQKLREPDRIHLEEETDHWQISEMPQNDDANA